MRSLNYLSFILVICLTGFVFWDKAYAPKNKYIEIKKLYDAFDMKKEYEAKYKKVESIRQKIIDSMEVQLKVLGKKIDMSRGKDNNAIAQFQVDKETFIRRKNEFSEDNAATIKDYDEKILKQLTQYIEDYGKANKLNYIFGYGGSGEVLYSKEENNITEEMIKFANSKYKGVN
ncbi:MAG TPA: OmpH family outer membrane protein [Bacteroidia bacterium]|nr:OmpH family outer membrane protein [Bacteroidia bacterium]